LRALLREFTQILEVEWELPNDLALIADEMLEAIGQTALCSKQARRRHLIVLVRSKFHMNKKKVQSFLNEAAKAKRYFDPTTKARITDLFDHADATGFAEWAGSQGLPSHLLQMFKPPTDDETLGYFHAQLEEATINRSDARRGVQEERRQSLLRSLFGSWLFRSSEAKAVMAFNAGMQPDEIEADYFSHLQRHYPTALKRSCGAYAIAVTASQIEECKEGELRAVLFRELVAAHDQLSNYSYVFVWFTLPRKSALHGKVWELVHDTTIYAERFQQDKLQAGYFHPSTIAQTTTDYVPGVDAAKAEFDTHQSGFAFRDCIVVCSDMVDAEHVSADVDSVLLLMERNVADERPIPCPACRSLNVRGNSYPVFGVKSWECQNALCPEKSAFDRGNRFSLSSILRAEASREPNALIPEESLTKWKLDVVGRKSKGEILDFIVRHYSLPGDRLTFVNWDELPASCRGRRITKRGFQASANGLSDPLSPFEQTPYFNRYLNVPSVARAEKWTKVEAHYPWLELYEGSCLDVLQSLPANTVDGAVTSPPYYNAREYSTWPNLYCYLYDMKVAAAGVYRTLKPGGYYLFNIFDYFDNDNIVAFSALGKRRLPLGAYMAQVFRTCGFSLEGNIVWHKGEIQGKRNYNQGNRAPFYQLPLNTWEHILVLRKPGQEVDTLAFPEALFCRPVLKWFNGENRHGHSAPFPHDIPDLLCSRLPPGARVLDPFAGSLTTAVVCHSHDQASVAIELHRPYCDLGLRKIAEDQAQLSLFDLPGVPT